MTAPNVQNVKKFDVTPTHYQAPKKISRVALLFGKIVSFIQIAFKGVDEVKIGA